MKIRRGIFRSWCAIAVLLAVATLASAQGQQQGWSGSDPEQRSGGCSFFTLTPNPTPPTCNSFEDGIASVIPSGGVGPYTYNWIGGPSTQSWNNVGAGTYTVIVFDQGQGGLPCNIDVFVNEPGPLTVFEMNSVAPTCFGACNGEASPIVIGGNGGYSLTWSSGETGFTADDLCNPFTLTVTDSEGCVLDSIYTFDDEPEDIVITVDSTNISCFGDVDGALDINVSGGNPDYTYSWSGPGGFTSVDEDISGLQAGSYTITVTDQNDCEAIETFEITEPDELSAVPVITNNPCAGDTLGSIELTIDGGTPDYGYSWSGPDGFTSDAQNIFNLISGDYDVEVTDANGCVLMDSFTIAEPPLIDIALDAAPISCNGEDDSEIDATVSGGAGDFTFAWSGPDSYSSVDEDIFNLGPGTYTLTVVDSSGCSNSASIELIEPEPLQVDGTVTDITCAGQSNGAITLAVSGGTPDYTFSWTGPGGFTSADQDLTGLAAGNYQVTITDDNGCETVTDFDIVEPAPIQLSADITDNECAGQEVGAIDLTITGGTAPYIIAWSGPDGFTSDEEDITNLAEGSYAIEVTDTNGCIQAGVFEVGETDPIELDLNVTALVCPDDATGEIDLQISGGTPDYNILWMGPDGFSSTDEDITGLSQGVYVVEVTDDNGCTANSAAEILALDTMVVTATTVPVTCNGGSNGSISATVSGGAPGYDFNWTGPDGFSANTADINGLSAGTYVLTVTDDNDCTTQISVELSENPPIDLSADITELSCEGVLNGEIDLTVSGGTLPYTFQWSGPGSFTANTEDIDNLNSGNYTVLVTDSLGCSSNANFAVDAGESVMAEAVVTDASCDTNDDGMIEATVTGGNPPYSIIWIGPNGFTDNTLTITDLEAGTYTLFATGQDDCFVEASFTVNNPSGIEIDGTVTDVLCASDPTGAINVTLTGVSGPITLVWSGPDGFTSNDEDISNLSGGAYTFTVIDSADCITQTVFNVDEPQPLDLSLIVTQPTCGESNGQVIATVSGGTVAGDYTYLWTDQNNNLIGSSNQINNLGSGVYTVTVADDNGCTVFQTVELSETDIEIDATITDLECNGDANGSIEIALSGGVPPYTFDWSGPDGFSSADQNIFDLAGGSYTLTVTDSLNCSNVEVYEVDEPAPIDIQLDSEDISCPGAGDGSITTSVTGGTPTYTFSWQGPGGFTSVDQDISDLQAGTYILTLTDDNGCVGNAQVEITEPLPIDVDADITPVNCAGQPEGAIDIAISGGTPPYIVQWSGPDGFSSDQPDISDLLAGDYILVLTDDNDCEFIDVYTVPEDDPILIDPTITPVTCTGDSDGAISVAVSGGTSDYTYAWTGPNGFVANTPDIDNLEPGDYELIVTDINGCFQAVTVVLLETTPIDISADVTELTCEGVLNGAIDITIIGGTPPYTFQWSGPGSFTANTEDIDGLNSGNYTVLVTDSLGCSSNANFAVGAGESVMAEAVVTDASCDTNDDGMIEATVTGGNPPYSIIWIGPNGFTDNTLTITGLEAGTYTLFATDQDDCFVEASFTVNNPSGIEIDGTVTDVLCASDPTGAIDVTLTGVSGPITLVWSGPDGFTSNDEDISNLSGGAYTITVIDSADCITQAVFNVDEPQPLDLSLIVTQPACGENNGQVIATVSGGTVAGDYTYLWTDEDNNLIGSTNQINNLGSGTYTVTIADDNGCTIVQSAVLIESDLEIDATISDLACNGDGDGAIETTITGGTPPYSFAWTGPDGFTSTDQSIFDLNGGSYTFTVTDSLGCSLEADYDVLEPDSIALSFNPINPLCNGDANGTIAATVTGGTPGYTTSWTGPDGFSSDQLSIADLVAGTYNLEVTDTNGCVATDQVVLVEPDSLVVEALIQDVACNGDTTGAIDLTIIGGTPDYTLLWTGPDGFSSDQLSLLNLEAGTYNLEVIDANFCALDTFFVVNEPDTLQITATVNAISCNGENDGSISIVPTGGTPEYIVNWNGPEGFTSSETSIDSLSPGAYNLTLTDSLGCQLDTVFTITEPELLEFETAITQPECLQFNGAITAAVTGGTPPYSFSWENDLGNELSTDSTISGLAAGLYTLTVTDTNGCEVSEVIPLSDLGGEILAEITNVSCFGGSDGAILTTVLNAVEPLEYAWSNPDGFTANTPDIADLTANIYNLIVTDSLGCVYVESFEVTEPDSLTLTPVVEGISCFGGDGSIALNVSGGTAPYDVSWTGPDGFSADTLVIDNLNEGDYIATITDSLGCTAEINVNLTELDPLALDFNASDITCFGADDGSLEALVSGGEQPYSYIWIGPNGFTANTDTITNLEPGFYEVQVTDTNGCIITDGVMIDDPTELTLMTSVNNSTCGDDNGSASASASGGTVAADYNYTWFDADGNVIADVPGLNNLAPGAYTVIVTDDNGCEATETIVISDADGEIDGVVTQPSCSTGDDGAIAITVSGGTLPYTYSWTGPDGYTSVDQNIDSLFPGTYIVEVTDSAGCIFVEQFELMVPQTVELTLVVDQISCNGANDGSIEVSFEGGTPPYSIDWQGPDGFASADTLIQDLAPGTYIVTVIDSALCASSQSVDIFEPAPITANISVTENLCADDNNGSITITVSGGTQPYTFQWIGPNGFESQGQNLGGLFSGFYEVLVTDTMGCTATFSTEILSTPAIQVALTVDAPQCFGDTTGAINAVVSGGTPGFDFQWTGPDGFSDTIPNISGLVPGDYELVVTDSNGCSVAIDTSLTQPDSLFAELLSDPITCNGLNDGSISAEVSGGTAPYTYSWTGPSGFVDTSAVIDALSPGSYELTYSDSLGCSGNESIVISEPLLLEVSLESLNDALCNTDNSGLIAVSVSGGTQPYVFNWNGPDGYTSDQQDIDNLFPGNYELMVIDTNGCTATLIDTVDFTFEINAEAGIDTSLCENNQPYTLAGIPLNADSTWWSDASGNVLTGEDTLQVLELPGTYTYFYNVSNGLCFDVDSVVVSIFALPDAEAGPDQTVVEGAEVTLGGSPTSTTAVEYIWNPNIVLNDSTAANPFGVPETTTNFEVIVTDSNGCVNNDFILITVFPDIDIPSGISPNGDGFNDEWIIEHIEQFPENVVEVYNRWGDLLDRIEGYDNSEPWEGFYNGKLLPVGTYYYVIELNDERFPEPYTGPITIFR